MFHSHNHRPLKWKSSSWGPVIASFPYPVVGRTGGADKGVGIKIIAADTTAVDRGASWRTTVELKVWGGQQFTYTDWTKGNILVSLDAEFKMKNGSFLYQPLDRIVDTPLLWRKTMTRIMVPPGAVSMKVYRVAKHVGWFALDDVSLTRVPVPAGASGFVTFSFDDGLRQRDVPKLLWELGTPGTFYINSTPVIWRWDPGYFTAAEVRAIAINGNEVGNHTRQHLHLPDLSDAQLWSEIVGGKRDVEKIIGRMIFTFAYPYGEYDQRIIDVVAKRHLAARTTDNGLNARTQPQYLLKSFCPTRATPVGEVKMMIDEAAKTNQWLILCFDQIGQPGLYSYPLASLKELILYAKTKTRIITVMQGKLNYLGK
ncbi:MAG: polysaccharide deacetylase family protein [Parcubacteria group bacterium]|nr:polysaccharide deacetylase family protein [Parcubacteria group bacterium]